MKRPFLQFAVSCLFAFLCFDSSSFAASFEEAIGKYRSSQFTEAFSDFQSLLDQDPENVALLTNTALSAYQAGQKGLAVGLLKRALMQDPQNQTGVEALSFIQSQMNPKDLPRELPNWEVFRSEVLSFLTLPQWISLALLCGLAAIWALMSFLGRRRRAIKEGSPTPGLKMVEVILLVVGVLGLLTMTGKYIDSTQVRGVLLPENVSVYSAPNTQSVNLLTLHAGFEVVLLRQQDSWVQIQYPGSVTGWVEAKDVFWIDSTKAQN